jgi:hypothetical protein
MIFLRFWVDPEAPRFKLPPPARGAFFLSQDAQFSQQESVFHRDLLVTLEAP